MQLGAGSGLAVKRAGRESRTQYRMSKPDLTVRDTIEEVEANGVQQRATVADLPAIRSARKLANRLQRVGNRRVIAALHDGDNSYERRYLERVFAIEAIDLPRPRDSSRNERVEPRVKKLCSGGVDVVPRDFD